MRITGFSLYYSLGFAALAASKLPNWHESCLVVAVGAFLWCLGYWIAKVI